MRRRASEFAPVKSTDYIFIMSIYLPI